MYDMVNLLDLAREVEHKLALLISYEANLDKVLEPILSKAASNHQFRINHW